MSNKLNEKLVKSILTVKESAELNRAVAAELTRIDETESEEVEKLESLWENAKTGEGRAAAE